MTRLRNRLQSIYVMEAPTGECKIGIAEDPNKRLVGLCSSIPRGEIKLRFASEPSHHAWMFEKRAHEVLADKRLNGEWFDISADEATKLVRKIIDYVFSQQADMFADLPPTCEPKRRPWRKVDHPQVLDRLKTGENAASIASSLGISANRVRQIAYKNGLKLRILKCRTQSKQKASTKVLTDRGICRKERITKIARRAGAKPQSTRPKRPEATPTILSATRADRRGIAVRVLAALGYCLGFYKGAARAERFQILGPDGSPVTSRIKLDAVERWIEAEQARRCSGDLTVPTNMSFLNGPMAVDVGRVARGSVFARKDKVERKFSYPLCSE